MNTKGNASQSNINNPLFFFIILPTLCVMIVTMGLSWILGSNGGLSLRFFDKFGRSTKFYFDRNCQEFNLQ